MNRGKRETGADRWFLPVLGTIAATYGGLIALLLAADILYLLRPPGAEASEEVSWLSAFLSGPFFTSLAKPEIQYSIKLTLISCTVSAVLSVLVAIPSGYVLARTKSKLSTALDALIDIPIVLPPLVIGLSLLILFQFFPFTLPVPGSPGSTFAHFVVYQVPAVILAQFTVSAAFAIRTMKIAFAELNPRSEQIALTLGCNRFGAFFRVVLPSLPRAMVAAGCIAWARALGEFGPLLIFAGATRGKTEVLSTTVFLELSIGNLDAAVAVSLYMVIAALLILYAVRHFTERRI